MGNESNKWIDRMLKLSRIAGQRCVGEQWRHLPVVWASSRSRWTRPCPCRAVGRQRCPSPRCTHRTPSRASQAYNRRHVIKSLRGFAKLNNSKNPQKNLDRAHPTDPPPHQLFFFEIHHWHGQNTQIIINNNLYWFMAILGRFSTKKFRVRPGPSHPLP